MDSDLAWWNSKAESVRQDHAVGGVDALGSTYRMSLTAGQLAVIKAAFEWRRYEAPVRDRLLSLAREGDHDAEPGGRDDQDDAEDEPAPVDEAGRARTLYGQSMLDLAGWVLSQGADDDPFWMPEPHDSPAAGSEEEGPAIDQPGTPGQAE